MTKNELLTAIRAYGISVSKKQTKRELEALYKEIQEAEVAKLNSDKSIIPEQRTAELKDEKYSATYISKGKRYLLGSFDSREDAIRALRKKGAYNYNIS